MSNVFVLQIRLRNLTHVFLLNVPAALNGHLGYFTLHVNPMSAPYYTSPKVPFAIDGRRGGGATLWPEIQLSHCSTRLSASSTIVRVWTGDGIPVLAWGLHFRGLHHLGHRDEWDNIVGEFMEKTLIFVTPFGSFTSLCSLLSPPVQPQRFLRIKTTSDTPLRSSYTLQKLVSLHHYQRSVLEEVREFGGIRWAVCDWQLFCERLNGGLFFNLACPWRTIKDGFRNAWLRSWEGFGG